MSNLPSQNLPVPFEKQLNQNLGWAMSEGSLYFEGRGKVQDSLKRITKRLDELDISYAIAGGMALYLQGYHRFTEEVDILVTPENLERIHHELVGLGYVRRFATSKNLRDCESGVKIEFLVTGDYPGDDKPKDISFPDPSVVVDIRDGIKVLNVPTLISLKIASYMTGVGRGKDLGDVQELIKLLNLPESLSTAIHLSVRDKYIELWRSLHVGQTRYILVWENRWLGSDVHTLEDMIKVSNGPIQELESMHADGLVLDPNIGVSGDYVHFVTADQVIAEKYGMEEESQLWNRRTKKQAGD